MSMSSEGEMQDLNFEDLELNYKFEILDVIIFIIS